MAQNEANGTTGIVSSVVDGTAMAVVAGLLTAFVALILTYFGEPPTVTTMAIIYLIYSVGVANTMELKAIRRAI